MNRDPETTNQTATPSDITELNEDQLEIVGGAGGVPDWG